MAEPQAPRRLDGPIPEEPGDIDLDLDYWTDQLSECSGGSERRYAVEARLRGLQRAKERLFHRSVTPPDSEEIARRALLGYRETVRKQDRILGKQDPASGNMSLVRPVRNQFDLIHDKFPGLIPEFDQNSISVTGLRLQITSALGAISGRLAEYKGTMVNAQEEEGAREQMIDIFISHSSHADTDVAEAFADLFQSAFNIDCDAIRCSSVPRYAPPFGRDVPEQIKEEVLGASVLIGIVTESSRDSAWVLFELGARWGASRFLIPVLVANSKTDVLPPPIRDSHAVTCTFENVIKLLEDISNPLNKSIVKTSGYLKKVGAVIKAAKSTHAPSGTDDGPVPKTSLTGVSAGIALPQSIRTDPAISPHELCLRSAECDLRVCIRSYFHQKHFGLLYKLISDRCDDLEQVRVWVREARSLDFQKGALQPNGLNSAVRIAIARKSNSSAKSGFLQAGHESNEPWLVLIGSENSLTLGDGGGGPLIWPGGDPNTVRTWHLALSVEAITQHGASLKPWEFVIAVDWITETNTLHAFMPKDMLSHGQPG